ncbi:MAG: hypothetical protein HYU36_13315 [Planctomycetes bacterium]|nr:hypothetical protein [Planctomycetota bacterium]
MSVSRAVESVREDSAEIHKRLEDMDLWAREEMAFSPPELSLPAAQWAATTLYKACQLLVYRDLDAEAVRQAFSQPCPEAPGPRTAYSVDMTFRYLPDLITLARAAAEKDSLVAELLALARNWPLSSVGVKNLGDIEVSALLDDSSLRQLYVDRILERRDTSRLADPRVRAAIQEALGAFPDLSPEMVKALAASGVNSEE